MLLLQAILGVVDIFAESFIIFLTKCLGMAVQVLVHEPISVQSSRLSSLNIPARRSSPECAPTILDELVLPPLTQ